jgi:predicted ATPase
MALCTEQGFVHLLAEGNIFWGWARAAQGQGEAGIRQLRQGLAAYRAIGAEIDWSHYLAFLAEAQGKAGQAEEGLEAVSEALTHVDKTGVHVHEAELYRLKGELTLQSRQVKNKSQVSQGKSKQVGASQKKFEVTGPQAEAEAEACFHKAVEIARKQQAKLLELRAATSLARLWQHQGKKEEARQMLAEIYSWFTEGFDTADLQEAKALLEELA